MKSIKQIAQLSSKKCTAWTDTEFHLFIIRKSEQRINPQLLYSTEKTLLTGITTHSAYEYSDYDLPSSITVNKTSKSMKQP